MSKRYLVPILLLVLVLFIFPAKAQTISTAPPVVGVNVPGVQYMSAAAASYRAYLKIMTVLKELRDHSTLNQATPIISAGLADGGLPGKKPGQRLDGVSIPATLEFLRQNGLDKLVDGYGVHIYPGGDPNKTVSQLIDQLNKDPFSVYTAGKPYWVTEWGFNNNDTSCPLDDGIRMKLVGTMRSALQHFADQGRLAASIYYSWGGHPGETGSTIFRCDALTDAGKLALKPINAATQISVAPPHVEYVKIRVGLPRVVRGPSPGIPDSKFTEIQLPGGTFRGFSASTSTYAIDGTTPWAMSGTAVPVLSPGAPGTYDASGQWLNHVERSENTLLGWVHCETGDAPGQGLKSISLVKSDDDGMTWEKLGQIISGKDPLTPGKITGEGDCSVVNGQDGYYYAYCSRASDHALIVARAPLEDPGPGHWLKYFNGKWSEPGLGGNSTRLIDNSAGLAQWTSTGQTVGLGSVPGGTGIFFSFDHINFTPLHEPLLPINPGNWNRPDPNELSSYFTILNADNGTNQLGNRWLLVYMYIQPNESFSKRYLVFRPVDVSISSSPVKPQIGVLLARWFNPTLHDRWTTTAPVPGDYNTYYLDAQLGYLMTIADSASPSVRLEEYVKVQSERPDHLLTLKDADESRGYQHLRTAGWVYARQEPDTQPLYECYSETEHTHFVSNNPGGDGKGKMVRLLGYALIH